MSAVRRSGRSGARPSPYARPPSKKSSWSISSILSYFNPLKSRVQEEILPVTEDHTDESDYNPEELGQSPAQTLSTRGHQLSRSLKSKGVDNVTPSRPAPTITNTHQSTLLQSPTSPFVEPTSPSEGIEMVTSFLESRRDRHITSIEAEGLISLLKKSSSETREPFRFSSSPSTPQRGNSPLFASSSTSSNPFRFSTPTESSNQTLNSTTPKLLKSNPNGKYRWQGGGSAKPRSRNRYQSPAFGSSRASSERLVLRESPEKIKTDTKRRRVGDEPESSNASPSGSTTIRSAAPAPSPTRTAQAPTLSTPNGGPSGSGKVNGINTSLSSSHLRTSVVQKPTTPVVPSPLRQAWGQSSPSNSDSEGGSPAPPPKQTRAANFMAELITQVSTTKHLDVSNPYQAASPVKHTGQPKPRSKRIRAGKSVSKIDVNGAEAGFQDGKEKEKETEKEKEKEKEKEVEKQYSAQAIIEATLPKGSKRSRPPPAINNGTANGPAHPTASRSPPPTQSQFSVQIEEVDDEDERDRSPKKSKPNGGINGTAPKPLKSVPTIEEISETEVSSSKMTITPSEVIEPGSQPKTFSFSSSASLGLGMPSSLSKSSSLPVFGAPKSNTIPKEPSKLRQSMKMDTPTTPAAAPSSSSTPSSSPFFTSAAPKAPAPDATSPPNLPPADPKQAVLDMPVPTLPTFTFSVPATVSFSDSDAIAKAKSSPLSNLPKYEFKIASLSATSSSTPATSSGSQAAKQSQPPSVQTQGFNWSAAGIKPPPKPAQGSWNCTECGLSNSDASAAKCMICDAPR